MKSTILDKSKLVNSVFSKVYKKYDLMNDIMSFGIHRIWKDKFIDWMNPCSGSKLIDVASGTGDIAKLFSKRNENLSEITCIEPNNEMFQEGRNNLKDFKNVKWIKAKAESIPVKNNFYDFYSISYGIRNVSDINKTLKEAYRVLKPGGKLGILEFSSPHSKIVGSLFKIYFHYILPKVASLFSRSDAYRYLPESVDFFPSRKNICDKIINSGFKEAIYTDLTFGISSIFIGIKNDV